MSFGSTAARGGVAGIIYLATAFANICDNAASAPITNIQSSLHTADPTSGNQTTSEATYTSYARVATARTSGGFSNTAGVITNLAAITFPSCTGGSNTITHVNTGTASSGAGVGLVAGALTASLAVSTGIQPQFAISGLTITVA